MPIALVAALALGILAAPVSTARAAAAAPGGQVQVAELSPEAEQAINRGLRYLAAHQNPDGSWGNRHQVAITSLSLMAFMLQGHFPKKGEYGTLLDKGVDFLLGRSAQGGGYMGSHNYGMYEHALATLALSEVWGMSDRKEIRDAIKRAVEIILRSQNKEGGWRYHPRPESADISVTVMQVVALASASEAGILVPKKVIDRALAYVKRCQKKFEGGFGYQPGREPRLSSSAAGLMSLLMCGERDSKAVERALRYLKGLSEEKFDDTRWYYYAHYYAIQAMYQAGEAHYQDWYPQIRDALLAKQKDDGQWKGGAGHDPSYGTAMSILILGVPYRFLPIYQR
ncbi:MAG: prenyltransferase/squalene oxidase repeat-containing protein [Planctomycetota bacterium]